MKRYISILLVLLPFFVSAQKFFAQDNSIPVFEGARQLKNPWAGGLNNPQFAPADLDGDGIDDLVVFNRGTIEGGQFVLTFINGGTPNKVDYTYAPQYVQDLPKLSHWMLGHDYNCDGTPDFLTSEEPSLIVLHTGTRQSNGRLSFTRQGYLNFTTQTGTQNTNIYVSSVDIPAMTDVNGDGDLDVLTFSQNGFRLEYFENLSVESGNGCGDTIGFRVGSYCWGDFNENGTYRAVTLNEPCGPPKMGDGEVEGSNRHAGSTVMAFDENGDGLKEVLLGDISFTNVVKLLNGGNVDSAVIVSQDTLFPSYNRSVDLPIFPACFYTDVDNDGREDLLVGPNTPKKGFNHNCSWFYKDVSTNATVQFQFQTDTFLVNDMIDVGEAAYPAFADINGDGLMDMVVGNNGYYESTSTSISGLALFINVGTVAGPVFRLVDKDYMDFSNYFTGGVKLQSLAPVFHDMNGDGAVDMIVGDHQGFLHYFRNHAPAGDSMVLVLEGHQYKNIDVGNHAKPEVFDVNGDGLPDLIIGKINGALQYYENIGTATNPDFSSVASNFAFGEVLVKINFLDGYSAPRVVKLAHSNQPYLMVGNLYGNISIYELDATKRYSGAFTKTDSVFSRIDVGEYATLAIADIDNDGKWEMAVGNLRGGINFYQETDHLGVAETAPEITASAYPNPSGGHWQLALDQLKPNQEMHIAVYDLLGEKVYEATHLPQSSQMVLPLQLSVESGIYFCRVQQGGSSIVFRLLAQ